jgi:hypothetical protein
MALTQIDRSLFLTLFHLARPRLVGRAHPFAAAVDVVLCSTAVHSQLLSPAPGEEAAATVFLVISRPLFFSRHRGFSHAGSHRPP